MTPIEDAAAAAAAAAAVAFTAAAATPEWKPATHDKKFGVGVTAAATAAVVDVDVRGVRLGRLFGLSGRSWS